MSAIIAVRGCMMVLMWQIRDIYNENQWIMRYDKWIWIGLGVWYTMLAVAA
jgi:hypothetical protein